MSATARPTDVLGLVCPGCRGRLELRGGDGRGCDACRRDYRDVAGIPDLRLASDRYLGLDAERAKACRLHAVEADTDLTGLASTYYDLTDDVVDRRRDRFLKHIAGAVARGEALARRLPAGGDVLEVGCGTGGLLVAAARAGLSITGADIASRWLVVARRRLADHGLSVPLVAAEAERLPWPDARFDVVVADSLLEHLDDPAAALREWRRVLRPGGTLLLWSPNRYAASADPHLGIWGPGWLPRALVPAYLNLRGKSEWPPRTLSAVEAGRLARRAGLVRVAVDVPEVSEHWARTRPAAEQRALRAYRRLSGNRLGRALLRQFGPLWELSAESGGAG